MWTKSFYEEEEMINEGKIDWLRVIYLVRRIVWWTVEEVARVLAQEMSLVIINKAELAHSEKVFL